MVDGMELIAAVSGGVGLAAASGFRVFVPLLALSLAARAGVIDPSGSLAWVGSTPALATFAVATLVEVLAFYVPWVDNLLDTAATPGALGAGTVSMATVLSTLMPEAHPALTWTTAAVAGGGIAGAVQIATVILRAASTATTGGLGNFVVSTIEAVLSVVLALLALLLPIVAGAVLVVVLVVLLGMIRRRRRPDAGRVNGAG